MTGSRVIASNIASLRASSSLFLKQDFRNVKWAGVFGSFARETQTDSSDVDVVVIQEPRDYSCDIPPETRHLEDALPEVWGRKVDVVHIEGLEIRGYVSIEALLGSRTIFGSDQGDEIVQLRAIAKGVLDSGIAKFTKILSRIRRIQSILANANLEVHNHY